MRFAYHASMCAPDQYIPLARAVEAAGFDSFTFPDGICYPPMTRRVKLAIPSGTVTPASTPDTPAPATVAPPPTATRWASGSGRRWPS
mgnify:CR=1 FL=1